MSAKLRKFVRSTWIYNLATKFRRSIHYRRWLKNGCPHPPSCFVKHRILKEYARRFPADVFVETGTFKGDMITALKDDFKEIHSIEIVPEFVETARKLFRKDPHVTIHEGDSGKVIKEVLEQIKGKSAMFWLDGHYYSEVPKIAEEECPIVEEIAAIKNSDVDPVVVLVDDVREFDGTRGYLTLDDLKDELDTLGDGRQYYYLDDIIRWHR
ncbi:MAG: hypothetical protein ACR2RV_25155 [Verrucomicrobiales bacterium]